MSKMPGRQQRMKTICNNKTTHEDEEEMKKLKMEIRLLKLHISQLMSTDIMSFKDICVSQMGKVAKISQGNSSEVLDIEAEIKNDLYTFAGFCCKKMGDQFIFSFQSFEKGLYSNKNWIELCKFGEQWQLGKWAMPFPVNVEVLFAKYTIDTAASMKRFLRECKHSLDCYHQREAEVMKLKAFLLDLGSSRISLQTNYGYTRIALNLVRSVCASLEESRYIVVLLGYKINEARPSKVVFDCEGENSLSRAETKVLKDLFKKLKEESLKEVMEEVLTSDASPFICKPDSRNNSIIDENAEDDSDGELSFLEVLKKNRKPKKKQRKISSKNDKKDNEVSEDDDRRDNDLSIDTADRSNSQFNEEDVSQVDIPKIGGKRSTKPKSLKQKSSYKTATNVKADKNTRTAQTIEKERLLLHNRNYDVSNPGQNDGKTIRKTIVPEIFKPKGKQTKGFLEEVNAVDAQLLKLAKRSNKTRNRGKKIALSGENSTLAPANRSRVEFVCSTPTVGHPPNLSTVAKKHISAIGKENMIIMTDITGIEKIQEASAPNDSDEPSLDESECKDITKVENSHKELLEDLQAVKDNIRATNKRSKRTTKFLAGKKKKSLEDKVADFKNDL